MKTQLQCFPCMCRQALDAAEMISDDPAEQERLLRAGLGLIAASDLGESPPLIAARMHAELRRLGNHGDPYQPVKHRFNQFALGLLPRLEAMVAAAEDPFETAVRLAIAGNIIDFGVHTGIDEDGVMQTIEHALTDPALRPERLEALRRAVRDAQRILYLGDNAGEIVFDRLLIGQLPRERVTFVVRGTPIINDVTRADAEDVGLTDLVEVIDNGAGAPGTPLAACSAGFRDRWQAADLVIAKGQGNFETLDGVDKQVFFLLKVKCPVVAALTGQPLGEIALLGPGDRK